MELISEDPHHTTIKFDTHEILNIKSALLGLCEEYDHVNEEIIGVTGEYLKTLVDKLFALGKEAKSE